MSLTLVKFESQTCTTLFSGFPQLDHTDIRINAWAMTNNCLLVHAGPTIAMKNGREIWRLDHAPKGTHFAVDESGAVLKVFMVNDDDNVQRRHFEISLPNCPASVFEVARLDEPVLKQAAVLAFSQGVGVIGQGNKRVIILEFDQGGTNY
jgi:hypothetical protein